ncbi:LOW QUALITY PROTEIN: putative L-type lectin-domain containing receptor kinase II.2 [Pistacia vera]|uniref:LOW QUALITY PROTEIN: putative L-type lectin-domain containing receptor kinase II.2 n=1 Tax=Pistacia vera TaxID=55513 RepID=UPI0012632464|nr:LOW QUALITY PROTEIN: putative L-type lectin-domain containing receptor kinase II.2 [Pistacia vera]
MAALRSFYFHVVFNLSLISMAIPQDENHFIYHGFNEAKLHLDGMAKIHPNGLLQLTHTTQIETGHAFYPFPFQFNTSSSQSLSFSINFVFSIVPNNNYSSHGMAFVISPSVDFSKAMATQYLGLFNSSNNGLHTNHILAVELDTIQSTEFYDINGNHVGIDVNSLISTDSAPPTYYSDKEGKNKTLQLASGIPIQIWIDYNGTEKLLNVKLAPVGIPKPNIPLLSATIDASKILLDSMYVGFSASTGTLVSDQYVLGWSFSTSGEAQSLDISKLPSLPRAPIVLSPPPSISPPTPKAGEKAEPVVIVSLVAVAVVVITISGAVYIVMKKKYEEVYEDWEKEYGPQRFSYKNLYKATKGFKDKELIGQGGFGKVYKGVLPSSNLQIAVKRVSHVSEQGMKEFVAEIVSMGKLRHRNLVQLRGYCRRRGELLLVYDFMPNGSLDKILYSNRIPNLNWFQRFRIIRGVASGLLYLHEEWEQVVLHRDIKPGNVLLDAGLNGKLGDFGLARSYDRGSNPETTNLVGTVGYLAPEFIRTGRATTSTDVFAFGACMLEVACGRRPIEPGKVNLVTWVIDCWKRGDILDACDPRLEGLYGEEQMEMVLKLGLFCSHPNPEVRPGMRQVMQYLDGDATLPHMTLDNSVIASLAASNEASYSEITFPLFSIESNISALTISTIDSILLDGR